MNPVERIKAWINMCSEFLGPNAYLQALVILAITIVVATIATTVLRRVVGRFTRFSKTDVDDQLVKMLNRPIFMTIFLIGLSLAIARFDLSEIAHGRILSTIKSIGIWIWLIFAMGFTRVFLSVLKNAGPRFSLVDSRTLPLLQNAVYMLVLLAAVYALLNAWNINVTGLVASAGILGLALSFAAKDTLANVFAGVSILADNPYKIGDYVVLGSGERGEVTQIGIRSTRILTRDDVEITIPNAVIGNEKIVNETGGPHEKYRIRSKVSVAYDSDLDHVCTLLKDISVNHPGVCDTPVPRVRVRGFGDHGIDIELLSWVPRPVDRGRVSHELYLKIFSVFNQQKISIPFPQQDVYIKNITGANASNEQS